MENEELDYQLLARYMAGECTSHERRQLEDWASASQKNEAKLKQFRKIWNISEQKEGALGHFFDANEPWDQLQNRLDREREQVSAKQSTVSSKYRSASIHSMSNKVVRVAAIFLIAGLVGVFAYQNWYQSESKAQKPVLREVSTANAQRVNLTLSDGTEVMLNADTRMKFPNRFENNVREVFLKGEAYFDVASNPEKPFVIHSRGSVIRVLGTSFTVSSYQEDQRVRVVVKEGKVSLSGGSADSTSQVTLTANEMGRFMLGSQKIETRKVRDMQLYFSWREGYLKFREESMSHVAKDLERRYGIEVSFQDSGISDKKLTAFLKSRSIRNVLDVIAMSLDLEYQLKNNKVSFYQKK